MPDAIETNPAAAGPTTSEHGFTQWAAIISTAIATAGGVLAGAGVILTSLHDAFPTAGWITAAVGFVTGIGGLVAAVAKYTGARADVKTAILNNDAAVTLAGKAPPQVDVGRPANP